MSFGTSRRRDWFLQLACSLTLLALTGLPSLCSPQTSDPAAKPPPQQTVPNPALPQPLEALLREGFRLYEQNQNDQAQKLFEQAVNLAQEQKNIGGEAEAHRGLGLVLYGKARYAAAVPELQRALELFHGLGDRLGVARTSNHLGSVAWAMGKYADSEQFYRKALAEYEALGHLRGKATVLLNLTFLPGDPTEEDRLLEQGLAIARQLGDKGLEGTFLHNWGDKKFMRGDFAAALEKLEQAVKCLEESGQRSDLSRVLTSLGRIHRAHGSYELALAFYRRAMVIQEELGDKLGVIQSLNTMAVAYGFLNRTKEVFECYHRALELARQTGSPRAIEFILGGLAGAYLDQGDYARAVETTQEALRVHPDTELAQYRFGVLSEAYLGLGRYAEALEAAEEATRQAQKTENLQYLSRPLYLRARAKHKLGKINEALADAREALGILEKLRARLVPADFMKRGFAERHQELFAFTIQLHHQEGQYERALEVAEQARARAFLDLLASRQIEGKASEGTQIAAVRQLALDLKAKGLDPAERSRADVYEVILRGSGPEVAALWKQWQEADPEVRSLVSAVPPAVEEMAAIAQRLHSTILTYWVGSEATLIWVIQQDGRIQTTSLAVSEKKLAQLVKETRAGIEDASPDLPPSEKAGSETRVASGPPGKLPLRGGDVLLLGNAPKRAWRELYRLLIKPVRETLPRGRGSLLTVVPHGPLLLLSFAALQDANGRYLIEDYTLHYAPSVAVLQITARKKQGGSGQAPHYLLVADPAGLPELPTGKRLPALPGARREVTAIARGLPRDAVAFLTGSQAHEPAVRQAAPGKTVLHFATHAIVGDDQAQDGFLALGSSSAAPAEDGRLTAKEIYALDLQADLVFLSACRTGLGKVSGDGIVGLTRAFFYAGTPSVIATLWDVADQPTHLLVSEFYTLLRRDHNKGRALRRAQLRLLRALRAGKVQVQTPAGSFCCRKIPSSGPALSSWAKRKIPINSLSALAPRLETSPFS